MKRHEPTLILGGSGKTGRVERALGRKPRSFGDYARAAAAAGAWA